MKLKNWTRLLDFNFINLVPSQRPKIGQWMIFKGPKRTERHSLSSNLFVKGPMIVHSYRDVKLASLMLWTFLFQDILDQQHLNSLTTALGYVCPEMIDTKLERSNKLNSPIFLNQTCAHAY